MTNYNELRDGQEFYANGYKQGYEDAKKEFKPKLAETVCGNNQAGMAVCPFCGASQHKQYKNFCPNCGADMRKGGAEE